jgi:hypothetical protein
MTVPVLMVPKYRFDFKASDNNPDFNLLNNIVKTVVEELDGRVGVKRTGHDTWMWTSNNELERFLTYYYLKYGNQYPTKLKTD